MSIPHTRDLSSLSVEDLKALRKRWYEEARQDGSVAAIGRVVRELGTSHPKKHGANWIWSDDGIRIILDDWTGHTYVMDGDRQVFAHNYTCELFVPGPWMDVISAADVEAQARVAARDTARADDERAALLSQLGAAPGCQVCGESHGVSVPCGYRREAR